jgi:hypothetical protein
MQLRSSGLNPQDGVLGATSLSWWVDLHHDAHTHPLCSPPRVPAAASRL